MFVLAHYFHFHSPRQMLRVLSRDEILDALAFYEIDMPGDRRADLRAFAAALVVKSLGDADPPKPLYPYYGDSIEQEIEDEEEIEYMKAVQEWENGD